MFLFVYFMSYMCFSLCLCSFQVLKHVRLIDLQLLVSAMFFCLLCSGLGFFKVCLRAHAFACVRIQLAYVNRPMYAHACLYPKILIQFSTSFSLIISHNMLLLGPLFHAFEFLFQCLFVCLSSMCQIRVYFPFSLLCHEHALI